MKKREVAGLEEALKHCASEPIQHPGSIQRYGVLLCLDQSLNIVQASENAASFFGKSETNILGEPVKLLIGDNNAHRLKFHPLREMNRDLTSPQVCSMSMWVDIHHSHKEFVVQLHLSDGLLIVEFSSAYEFPSADVANDFLKPTHAALTNVESIDDLNRYLQGVAEQIRDITGYDRVMVYRFDNRWDGEVIAESKQDSLQSYLGLRFPASDIPEQARKLYTISHFRMIPDTEMATCKIEPEINPITGRPLDLSFSILRSLSPVHVQYLRNMNVQGAMSISILQNNRLWGLIACHHGHAKFLHYQVRSVAELIAQTVSRKLSNLENLEEDAFLARMQETLFKLAGNALRNRTSLESVLKSIANELLDLMRASGCLISIRGKRIGIGTLPDEVATESLCDWLGHRVPAEVFYTDCLPSLFSEMENHAATASGILLAPLTRDMSDFVMWFRPEVIASVTWAGHMNSPKLNQDNQYRLSPRKSFESWQEQRYGYSQPWSNIEIGQAYDLALHLIVAFSRNY